MVKPQPTFDRVTIRNFGCIRDLTLELSQLHALIGPNDTGKSTVLRAIGLALRFASPSFSPQAPPPDVTPHNGAAIRLQQGAIGYELALADGRAEERLVWGNAVVAALPRALGIGSQSLVAAASSLVPARALGNIKGSWPRDLTAGQIGFFGERDLATFPPGTTEEMPDLRGCHERFSAALGKGGRTVRLDPDAMRAPSPLIKAGDVVRLRDERGQGLAGVYDVLINQDFDAFVTIRTRVCELFPEVKSIATENVDEGKKVIKIQLQSGAWVLASDVSEGLLYYLAFAAMPYLAPAAIVLVEEPENGLHPARVGEVTRMLRESSAATQILLATHSPFVVNELAADEVSVVTRTREGGTRVKRIDQTPNFAERSKAYALGELWISYADGKDEAALLNGGPRP